MFKLSQNMLVPTVDVVGITNKPVSDVSVALRTGQFGANVFEF